MGILRSGSQDGLTKKWWLRRPAFVLSATLLCGAAIPAADVIFSTPDPGPSAAPPRAEGYFDLQPVGSWSKLPGDKQCADMIHTSTWEPRPVNTKRNNVEPDLAAVHEAMASRPRDTGDGYDPRWDSWLLQRVDGQFTGTTDEILQWGACKWGLPDDLLRAIALRESTWYQYPTYRSGTCVDTWGCGDIFTAPETGSKVFCSKLATFGYDYQQDYGQGMCPKTFSIVGVMAWHAPAWGQMKDNQNGTFPFSRDSTAFAVDYLGGYLRGCLEGWEVWLGHSYGPGQLWGCVGSWYSGAWRDPAGNDYARKVKAEWKNHTWLDIGWPLVGPPCTSVDGCVSTDPLALDSDDVD